MKLFQLLTLISLAFILQLQAVPFAGNVANSYYLEKQRFLLEILHHVQEPVLQEHWLSLGQQLVSDKTEYVLYNDYMRHFYETISNGRLLERSAYYSPQQPEHWQQTLGLYYYFYNTREWSTLRQNICWARRYANPGMFLYALTQVMMKRDDYRALIMPKIYELLPEVYYDEQLVRRARNFNFANWSRQCLLTANPTEVHEALPKQLLPAHIPAVRNTSAWHNAMSEVHILLLPAQPADGNRLAQLTGDIGWHAYWYYINMGLVLTQPKTGEEHQLHDWWYWQLAQLLARYKLERYGQNMNYKHLTRMEQQSSHLLTWQDERFQMESAPTSQLMLRLLDQLETAVEAALVSQSYRLANGTTIELRHGNNWLCALLELFPYDLSKLQTETAAEPQLLLDLNTMLHDANFYYYTERLLTAYRSFRSNFQAAYPVYSAPYDVRIEAVEVSPLITYDETTDADLSNLLHNKHFYYEGRFMWQHTLQAHKRRLQQKPFKLSFQLATNETQSVILRTFLTTLTGQSSEEPFYQLDAFLATLNAGVNRITRESRDFYGSIGDHISFTELYQYVALAEQGNYQFPLNLSTANCGFPRRLLLPQGSASKSLQLRLFVIATPYMYNSRVAPELQCVFTEGVSSLDELPLGYPFERYAEQSQLMGQHTYWQQVEIYHEQPSVA